MEGIQYATQSWSCSVCDYGLSVVTKEMESYEKIIMSCTTYPGDMKGVSGTWEIARVAWGGGSQRWEGSPGRKALHTVPQAAKALGICDS